mgnify:CR=1 FL=1
MKGNDDSDDKNTNMPMAPTLESLSRRHSAMTSKASQKPVIKLESKPNQSFVGKSLLNALRKQAARSQATKDRMAKMTEDTPPIIFHDET